MQSAQIIWRSVVQALQELRVNRLRTFLSLLGITIGIFCIIAVLTVLDSMRNNIQTEVNTLGSDVLYIGRWPWMDEGGEYKWWEFLRRPNMTPRELQAVENNVPNVAFATLCLQLRVNVKYVDQELESVQGYAVLNNFDRVQNIEIEDGRYLSAAELSGNSNAVVLGRRVYEDLFPGNVNAIGKSVSFMGKQYNVIGIMKKVGQNMAGFDFDNGVIYSYYSAASVVDVQSLNYEPVLMVKIAAGKSVEEVKYEVRGALRTMRKVQPGEPDDFAVNQLSQISERLDMLFGMINVIGSIIGGFSLLVGSFGIANIMFVTVKERTKIIGLKKAIGARSKSILLEFLIEAVTLCIAGGLIGIIVVLLLSLLLNYGFDFPITLSVKNFFVGISISAIVGIIAGFIPARAASKLDPVVAIRSN